MSRTGYIAGSRWQRRQLGQLDTPAGEERIGADEQGVGPLALNGRKGRIDLAAGARR